MRTIRRIRGRKQRELGGNNGCRLSGDRSRRRNGSMWTTLRDFVRKREFRRRAARIPVVALLTLTAASACHLLLVYEVHSSRLSSPNHSSRFESSKISLFSSSSGFLSFHLASCLPFVPLSSRRALRREESGHLDKREKDRSRSHLVCFC